MVCSRGKHDKMACLAILISHMFMFDVVCAVFSSFQLLGPWFESIRHGSATFGISSAIAVCHYDVFQLEVTQCVVVCPLCFAFDMYSSCDQRDDIDSVCAMFRANPLVEVAPCCVLLRKG